MKLNEYRFSKGRLVRAVMASALAVAVANAYADASSNIAVSATVGNACSIATTPMAFGSYSAVLQTVVEITGSVTVTCTTGFVTAILLNEGLHAGTGSSAAVPVRRMLSGTVDFLSYSISSNAARTVPWNGLTGEAYTGTGASTVLTMYGRVPAAQNVPTGNYLDTVIATILF